MPLRFTPGEKWEYSNLGYFTLAEIIRTVSGAALERSTCAEGLRAAPHGRTCPPDDDAGSQPRHRLYDNNNPRERPHWPALRPSGAFLSTVTDLAKWDARSIPTAAPEATRRADVDAGHAQQRHHASVRLRLGSRIRRRSQAVRHGGSLPGFISEYARFVDDGVSVIVLMNMDDADVRGLARGVAALYLQDVPSRTGAR